MGIFETDKLRILKLKETDKVSHTSYNNVLDDMDNKLVGVSHIQDASHWSVFVPNKEYDKGDIIRYTALKSNQFALCIESGTSGSIEPALDQTGTIFTSGTARFQVIDLLKGQSQDGMLLTWLSGEHYERGILAYYNKSIYRCIRAHDATTFEADKNNWQEVYASLKIFAPAFYDKGDSVIYDGLIYQCTEAHTATSFNDTKWELIGGVGGANPWRSNTKYQRGQLVLYENSLWAANSKHISGTVFNKNDWTKITKPVIKEWEANTSYDRGTIVNISDLSYSVTNNFESTNTPQFGHVKPVYASLNSWKSGSYYAKGVVVSHDGKLYRSRQDHQDTVFNESFWDIVTDFAAVISEWDALKDYRAGSVIMNNGRMYRTSSNISKSGTFQPEWEYIGGEVVIKDWTPNTQYLKDDVVYHNGTLLRALVDNIGQDFNGNEWGRLLDNTFLAEWKENTFYGIGDIVIYNSEMWRSGSNHTSGTDFDINLWENLSGGSSGALQGWKQVTKLNAAANTKVTINFPETLTFCFPPIDVLILQPGSSNVVMSAYTFDVGDGSKFDYDASKVKFDGTVHLNTIHNIHMSDTEQLGSGYMSTSDEIDLNEFNYVSNIFIGGA